MSGYLANDTDIITRLCDGFRTAAVAQAEVVFAATDLHRLRRGEHLLRGVNPDRARESAYREVAIALNIVLRRAKEYVFLGTQLDTRLPATRTAFIAGDIDIERVRTIVDMLRNIDDDLVDLLEAEIAEWALHADADRLRGWVRTLLITIDPEGEADRREKAEYDRYVDSRDLPNGMIRITALMKAVGGREFITRVTRMAANDVCAHDPRTLKQRRSDAMAALANGAGCLACECGRTTCPKTSTDRTDITDDAADDRRDNVNDCNTDDHSDDAGDTADSRRGKDGKDNGAGHNGCGAPVKPLVYVGMSARTANGTGNHPALLYGYGAIDPRLARHIAGCGRTRPIREDYESSADPADTTKYRPGTQLAHQVRARDAMSKAPGSSFADSTTEGPVDHTRAYNHDDPKKGGPTTESNLDGYSDVTGHMFKTLAEHGLIDWREEQLPGRRRRWTSPTGLTYEAKPEGDYFLFGDTNMPETGDTS